MVEDEKEPGGTRGLFALPAVSFAQPRLPLFRSSGPSLAVSTVEGTPLAEVWAVKTPSLYVLMDPGGRTLLRVEVAVGRFGAARPVFRFTDGEGVEVGTARSARLVLHASELRARTATGDGIRFNRTAPGRREWLITDEAYAADDIRSECGRVTAGNVGALKSRQSYLVELGEGLGAQQRQVVIGSVVCLYLIRGGPIGGGS